MTKYVRLKSSPHEVTEVSDAEYTDFSRWGVVLEDVVPGTVGRKIDVEVSTKTVTAPKKKTSDTN